MKSIDIIVAELKEVGVKEAEIVLTKVFEAIQTSLPKIAIDAEATSMEKAAAGVLTPVLMGLKPAVEKLADLNHDGKIG